MKNTIVFILPLLKIDAASADGYYVGGAYDFIPGSAEVSLGYQANNFGVEAAALNRGKEEPLTKPGPQISLNMLAFIGSSLAFVKAGVVTGTGKTGYNIGGGFDFTLSDHWAIRSQVIHYRVTEDFRQGAESENLISVGLKYQFY